MFTQENTNGYTDEELAEMNQQLDALMESAPDKFSDPDGYHDALKANMGKIQNS